MCCHQFEVEARITSDLSDFIALPPPDNLYYSSPPVSPSVGRKAHIGSKKIVFQKHSGCPCFLVTSNHPLILYVVQQGWGPWRLGGRVRIHFPSGAGGISAVSDSKRPLYKSLQRAWCRSVLWKQNWAGRFSFIGRIVIDLMSERVWLISTHCLVIGELHCFTGKRTMKLENISLRM